MSNEPLGIYQELRERNDRYSEAIKIRRRIAFPPHITNGAQAQSFNPFMRAMRNRIMVAGKPNAGWARGGATVKYNRTIWPESHLGLSIDSVIGETIKASFLDPYEMFGPSQSWRFCHPRQVAMWMIDRYCPDYSLPQIGFILRRDHTTIIHGIDAVRCRLISHDNLTVAHVRRTRKALRAIAG